MPRIARIGPPLLLLVAVLAGMLLGPHIARQIVSNHRDADIQRIRTELKNNQALSELSGSFTSVAQIVEPSVVHIDVRGGGRGEDSGLAANGSGWVYDREGHIITNHHVVQSADEINVRFIDGAVRPARLVGSDVKTDIAVLKIDADMVQPAARSLEQVEQGQIVFAFGSPFRYAFSMSQGIVSSAEPRQLGITGSGGYERFIQTDAAINPGNSGGPLTNLYGEVVGMNTAIASDPRRPGGGGFMGLGFAIPVSLIQDVADQLIEQGEVVRGYLGVYIADLSPDLARSFDLPKASRGVLVEDVIKDGPADDAGILAGDIIVQIDGEEIDNVEDLRFEVSQHPPGRELEVTLLREGQRKTVSVELDRMPSSTARLRVNPFQRLRPSDEIPARELLRLGFLRIQTLVADQTDAAGADFVPGVLITEIDPGSMAFRAGLMPGRVITHVGDRRVRTVDEFEQAVNEATGPTRIASLAWDEQQGTYINSYAIFDLP